MLAKVVHHDILNVYYFDIQNLELIFSPGKFPEHTYTLCNISEFNERRVVCTGLSDLKYQCSCPESQWQKEIPYPNGGSISLLASFAVPQRKAIRSPALLPLSFENSMSKFEAAYIS